MKEKIKKITIFSLKVLLVVFLLITLAFDFCSIIRMINVGLQKLSASPETAHNVIMQVTINSVMVYVVTVIAHTFLAVYFSVKLFKKGKKAYNNNKNSFNEVKGEEKIEHN